MDVPPRARAIRLVLCVAVASALLLAGCASGAGTAGSGESPGFNAGGPMEVHASPSEAAGEQVRVPDVEGEDWEDAAHTVLDAGFEFGNVVAVADRHPRWSVISQSPSGGSLLEQGESVSLTLSMGPHPPETVDRLACLPEEDELDEPYCIGKLIKY
jgi:PASTA domain